MTPATRYLTARARRIDKVLGTRNKLKFLAADTVANWENALAIADNQETDILCERRYL